MRLWRAVLAIACCVLASAADAQQTPNLHLTIPPYGSYVNSWNTVLNGNFSLIDTWSLTAITNNSVTLQTMSGPLKLTALNATTGFQVNGAAPSNHCLVGNGTYYVDSSSCGGTSITLQTNSVSNASQALLNLVNPASFNGLTFTFSNPSGGQETFTVGGTLANSGLANSSMTLDGVSVALGGTATIGVPTVNTNAGPLVMSFSAGAGSCAFSGGTTTCTITGSSSGGGSVTNFVASSGSWPTWLVPSVATSTTTPTLSVSASAIPNSALATQTANTVLGALTATTPSGLAMPSCSGASNALIWTTSTGFGCNTITGGGSGTVTTFSAGNFSPLFTTSVATATSTPALTFAISNAAQNSVLAGPASGGAGAYSFQTAPTFSGANLTALPTNTSLYPTLNQATTANAATATALASSPAQCSGGKFATGVAASGAANCDSNLDDGSTTANTLTYAGSGGIKSSAAGIGQVQPAPGLFSTLGACTTSTVGIAIVTDSTTQTWGATVTGTGTPATPYTAVLCDGVNWTVFGK